MKTAWWIGLLGVSLLAGCGSKIQHRYADPTFDTDAFKAGRIVVGGVVVAVRDNPELDRVELSLGRLLEESLRKRKPARPVDDSASFVDALSAGDLASLLDRYRGVGNLAPAHLTALSAVGTRYVAFARVEREETEQGSSDSRYVGSQEEGTVEAVTFSTVRTVVTTFDVFDTTQGALVWTARFERDRGERRTREHSVSDLSTGRTEELGGALGGDGGFPDAPGLLGLLSDVFDEFAAELP